MSTTVTYKGETLTTVNNATKTLETKGTWLEDDLTLVDVSGGGSTLITKSISANGTYNASSDSADGYSQVTVTVPASAVDSGTKNITANGNNQDVVGYAAVDVAVPNSYSAGDEGKVVDNGALVAQTAHADVTPSTSDQTIDTTTNNSIKVKGDANLVAGNIKKDVTIFNTTGSYEGGGGGEWTTNGIAANSEPSGAINITASTVESYAFTRKSAITSVTGTCTTLKGNCFDTCTGLKTADFPNVTTGATSLFTGDTGLETLSLPLMTTKATYLAHNCQKLKTVTLSNMSGVGSNAFQQCYALQTLDLPKATSIDANAFYNARVLQTLILRHTSVVTLSNVSAFTNSPMRGYNSLNGTIYVPQSLISSYQTAGNWSTIYGEGHVTFSAIEGSQYE